MTEVFERGEYTVDWPRSKRKREDNDDGNAHCWTFCVVDEPITIIAVKNSKTQGRVVFVDLMNWFPVPLAEIGESLGIEKKTMPEFSADNETWFNYCERDSEITFKAFVGLLQWTKANDLCMFRYTAASQAMAAYRHRYMEKPIFVHDCEPIRKLERDSFYGGRTECWKLGDIDEMAFQYDVNSLYPYVMRQAEYPFVLDRFDDTAELSETIPNIDFSRATAEVEIETRNPIYPMRTPAGVLFPVGRFETTLCGRELENAYYRKEIRRVGKWAEYRTAPIFKLWVDDLWELRTAHKLAGDNIYAMFAKALMNSLFGKFAQLSPRWENMQHVMPALPWASWCEVNVNAGSVDKYRSFGSMGRRTICTSATGRRRCSCGRSAMPFSGSNCASITAG
jgi:hypothetical protein